MASKVRPKILRAAITLFSDFGYYGVTTRDLAKEARTTEGSIYRLFTNKEKLFGEALAGVVERSLDPSQFLLMLFEKEQARQDTGWVMTKVIKRWYESLPQNAARLLTQAYFVAPRLRHLAVSPYAPVDKIIEILATTIGRDQKIQARKLNPRHAATALILTLLHFKITYATSGSSASETEAVDAFIRVWLAGISPGCA
ncbi:MAG TPA: helix-turn-helix domain-containing protein [Candidatus Angelobacter sp.]